MKRVATAVALIAALASCAGSRTPSPSPADLTVYGAASLKGALEQATTAYESRVDVKLTITTDSSSALRTQIEQGAPADVFLSADVLNPTILVDAGLADGAAVLFAANVLTIIVPVDNPANVATPADLARAGVKILAAGDEVPITRYATATVANLGGLPGYPAGFADAYAANIVSREDNVRSIVAKIELGEGDAGIVYVSDAGASTEVASVAIPDEANVAATYAAVVVRASERREAAHAFLNWLAGPEGQAILADAGFRPAPAPP